MDVVDGSVESGHGPGGRGGVASRSGPARQRLNSTSIELGEQALGFAQRCLVVVGKAAVPPSGLGREYVRGHGQLQITTNNERRKLVDTDGVAARVGAGICDDLDRGDLVTGIGLDDP